MNLKNKETILRRDGTVFKIVDYIEDLEIRLKIIKGEIKEPLYYKNEHGGASLIDEFGCSHYISFKKVSKLLLEIVTEQMEIRKNKEYDKNKN